MPSFFCVFNESLVQEKESVILLMIRHDGMINGIKAALISEPHTEKKTKKPNDRKTTCSTSAE